VLVLSVSTTVFTLSHESEAEAIPTAPLLDCQVEAEAKAVETSMEFRISMAAKLGAITAL